MDRHLRRCWAQRSLGGRTGDPLGVDLLEQARAGVAVLGRLAVARGASDDREPGAAILRGGAARACPAPTRPYLSESPHPAAVVPLHRTTPPTPDPSARRSRTWGASP